METLNSGGPFGPDMFNVVLSGPHHSLSFSLLALATTHDGSVALLGPIFGTSSASDGGLKTSHGEGEGVHTPDKYAQVSPLDRVFLQTLAVAAATLQICPRTPRRASLDPCANVQASLLKRSAQNSRDTPQIY